MSTDKRIRMSDKEISLIYKALAFQDKALGYGDSDVLTLRDRFYALSQGTEKRTRWRLR